MSGSVFNYTGGVLGATFSGTMTTIDVRRGYKIRRKRRDVHGGNCGRLPSANILFISTPTPSNTPNRILQATAEPNADFGPPTRQCQTDRGGKDQSPDSLRAARQPPVMKPEMIAFHASSFCLYPFTAQSNVENIPPHTPKLPPVTGARALMTDIAPTSLSPYRPVNR